MRSMKKLSAPKKLSPLRKMALLTIMALMFVAALPYPASALGILPQAPADCVLKVGTDLKPAGDEAPVMIATKDQDKFNAYVKGDSQKLMETLGCAVKLGRTHLFMVPFFITYLIQFLLGVAGLIAVLFVVLGGYRYVIGGLIEDKDSGKKTILHAIVGLVVALSAWIVVNFIQIALTS